MNQSVREVRVQARYPRTQLCRSCAASIIWTISSSGKLKAVDTAPAHDGAWVIEMQGDEVVSVPWKEEIHDGWLRFNGHMLRCPGPLSGKK